MFVNKLFMVRVERNLCSSEACGEPGAIPAGRFGTTGALTVHSEYIRQDSKIHN